MHTTRHQQELAPSRWPDHAGRLPDGSAGDAAGDARVAAAPGTRLAATSPPLSLREIALVIAGGLVLALVTSWPLALHLGSRIAPDLGDPTRTAWQIAWEGHALLTNPLHLFDTNAFWPHLNSLAFSDSLLGYAPAGLFGSGVGAALVRYNLLFLLAWALPFIGAYMLGRELGLRPAGAAVAGAAFAYAPFRAAAAGHLHVLSSGGIPLTLFLLLRGYRRGTVVTVVAGWLVAAWQLSLGFTLGLPFSYLLALLAAIAAVLWWRRGRPALPRPLVLATVAGVLVFAAVGAYESRPYLKASHDYPTAARKISDVERYSTSPKALLAAPYQNRVWGSATASIRNGLRSRNEDVLFPGLMILLLAAVGMTARALPRWLRWSLLGAAALCAVLAMGLGLTGAGYPYRLLFDYAPGWNGVRVPARVIALTALALALLAGAGAHRLVGVARRDSLEPRLRTALPAGVAIALVGLVVFEGAGLQKHPVVPRAPTRLAALTGPELLLPTDSAHDRIYQLWSSDGFPHIANGVSTFDIPAQTDLRGGMQNFPDQPGVDKLRRLGIRTVVLDTQLENAGLPPANFSIPEPPHPDQAATKSLAGITGVTRRRLGSLVIFTIEPLGRRHAA
jgi:hypothetical protein